MLCRTTLSLVRFCSRGSAFKPITFKHRRSETGFDVLEDDRLRNKPKRSKPKKSGIRDRLPADEFTGPIPVVKAPITKNLNVTDRISATKKINKYGFSSNSSAEDVKNLHKYGSWSQTFTGNQTRDERISKCADDDASVIEDENSVREFREPSNNESAHTRYERRNAKALDAHWSPNRINHSGKKRHGKQKKDHGRTRQEMNEDILELEDSILQEYGEKEHVYGIHPVLLALRAGKREIYRVYCKEGLEESNPLINEIHKLCTDKGIEFRSLDGKVFKRVFGKGTVHQGVFCYAGYLPVDAFDISQLDVSQGGNSASSNWISPHDPDSSNSIETDVVDSSSNARYTLTSPSDDARLTAAEKSSESSSRELSSTTRATGSTDHKRLWVVLDRVVDPMNVGAILRSCSFFGVSRVLLTPSSAELSPVVSKASSGAAELLHLSVLPRPSEQLVQLQACGWQVVAAAPRVLPIPQGVDTAPQGVDTAPQRVDTAPQRVDTAPQGVDTAPQGVDTAPQGVDTAPQRIDTAPQGVDTAPQGVYTAPQVVASVPAEDYHVSAFQNSTDDASAVGGRPSPDGTAGVSHRGSARQSQTCAGLPHLGGERGPSAAEAGLASRSGSHQLCVPVRDLVFDRDTVLVVGNEGDGVNSSLTAVADTMVAVSAFHDGSAVGGSADMPCLNVSAATAVLLHAIRAAADRS